MSAATSGSPALGNARDLGGLPTRDGRRTRDGVLYRSDCPLAGDDPPAGLPRWPPRYVVDLRDPAEAAPGEHPLAGPGCAVVRLPMMTDPESVAATRDLTVIYTAALEQGAPALVRLLALVAAADGPLLVHCATGKDRTGIAAAVLLSAVGVTEEAVIDDYLATGPNLAATYARRGMRGGVGISEAAIRQVLGIAGEAGGAAAWLRARGAPPADLDRWRHRMLGR